MSATQALPRASEPTSSRPKPPHRRSAPMWLLAAAAILLAGGGGYFLGKGGHGKAKPKTKPQQNAPQGQPTVTFDPQQLQFADLKMGMASQTNLPMKLAVMGNVAPNLNGQAQVSPRLAGKVTHVFVNVGQTVVPGQMLATIVSPDLSQAQAAYHDALLRQVIAARTLTRQKRLAGLGQFSLPSLEQARIAFEQSQGEIQNDKDAVSTAQTQVEQALSQRDLTQKQLARDQALYDAQILSRQDLEQAQANAQQAQAALAAAQTVAQTALDKVANAQKRGRVAARELARQQAIYRGGFLTNQQIVDAQASYEQAVQQVVSTAQQVRLMGGSLIGIDGVLTLTAPIAGQVSDRMVSIGESVTPDRPVVSLLNLAVVIVVLSVYQEDLGGVRVGQAVTVTSNTAPGLVFHGTVSVIGANIDEATRTARVICAVTNPGRRLRPGVYVAGTIHGAALERVVAVPQYAVQRLNDNPVVFVRGSKQGEFQAQPVKTGATVNGLTQIVSGLNPGTEVVTKNAFLVKSQMLKDM